VIHGLQLSGAKVLYAVPEYDWTFNVFYPISVEEIDRQIREHPQITAIVVTSPTYEGVSADLN
jgi:arginine/lysine/ornithine decarboxylase